jgi:hypothetical protein
MKLRQGQLWKQGDAYIRIVQLERLEVGYKSLPHATCKEGTVHRVSKKDFCRLLKNAQLLPPPAVPPKVESRPPQPKPCASRDGGQTTHPRS